MSRKLIFLVPAAVVLALLLSVALYLYVPYRGFSQGEKFILIPPKAHLSRIARLLEREGVVRSASVFTRFVQVRYWRRSAKAGEYRFTEALSTAAVAVKLVRGDIFYHRVTIPEGLTGVEITLLLARAGLGSEQKFREAFRNPALIAQLDPKAKNLEGYLYPDTYFFTRASKEQEIINTLVESFRKVWSEERQKLARQRNTTVREVVTLASLIEKETGLAEERSLVSAVFQNRLRQNVKLACDPTVIYAVSLIKTFDGVINQSDLRIDSPYNTYLYPGLPPGPIANPGVASIDAALKPADVDYLYFVSRNDGSHIFSSSYQDHSRAVRQYQR
ncbi:MAG: endolytic transglycosylase MltG [Acidobacteria bacterium]|nr:endolytic transglycosylase MltG [Acidobacteriota bacterium]